MRPIARVILVLGLLWTSWLLMMLVHEAGHVVAANATGGTVQRVVWHPLKLSRTDVSPNPSPLVVAWAGPIGGAVLPLMLAAVLWRTRARHVAAFFAGFCLIANGVYLGVGWLDRAGDAGEIVRLGSPRWVLVSFGVIAMTAGLGLWHVVIERFRRRQDR